MICSRYFLALIFILAAASGRSQYYYKDILDTRQTQLTWKSYFANKVGKVDILSTERNGEATPGFECTQTVSRDYHTIQTFTKSADVQPSILQSFYDVNGRLTKTVDTSDAYNSTTIYNYNAEGEIDTIINTSLETDNKLMTSENHIWTYKNGKAVLMIKIKNGSDTTVVNFTADEKGNIIEERSVHQKENLPAVYYYYDNDQRLTDIVRYNEKAQRLLPDYIFGYGPEGIASMIFVPAGSDDYERWIYEYDSRGLKSAETCFNKRKEIMAKIIYRYSSQ
jgi:hypothetical protein